MQQQRGIAKLTVDDEVSGKRRSYERSNDTEAMVTDGDRCGVFTQSNGDDAVSSPTAA